MSLEVNVQVFIERRYNCGLVPRPSLAFNRGYGFKSVAAIKSLGRPGDEATVPVKKTHLNYNTQPLPYSIVSGKGINEIYTYYSDFVEAWITPLGNS